MANLRSIFVHKKKSSCLTLYIPQKIKMTGLSPSLNVMDCPCTNAHFSRFSKELMEFEFEGIWKTARLSLKGCISYSGLGWGNISLFTLLKGTVLWYTNLSNIKDPVIVPLTYPLVSLGCLHD